MIDHRRLDIIVSALSGKINKKINVIADGPSVAWTEGNNIYISRSKLNSALKASPNKNAKALLYKETAHALYTDEDLLLGLQDPTWRAQNLDKNVKKNSELKRIFESLEDLRVEKNISDIYEGVEYDLKEYSKLDLNNVGTSLNKEHKSDIAKGLYYSQLNGVEAKKVMSKEVYNRIQEVKEFGDKAQKAKSSNEVMELTVDLYNKLVEKDNKEEEKQQQEKGQGKGQGKQQQSPSGRKLNKKEIMENVQRVKMNSNQRSNNQRHKGTQIQLPPEINFSSIHEFTVATDVEDKIEKVKQDNLPRHEKIMENQSQTILTLKRKLKNVFIANSKTRYLSGYTEGQKIDTIALPKIILDDDRLFQRRYQKHKKEVSFSILMDNSGSMHSNIKLLIQSVSVLSQVLSVANIPFELLSFTTRAGNHSKIMDKEYDSGKLVPRTIRSDSLKLDIYKEYRESYNGNIKGRLGTMTGGHNTPFAEPILWAYKRARVRPEKDNYLIVFTDGWPGIYGVTSEIHNAYSKLVIENIEKAGRVKLVGVGMQCDSVKKFFSNYIVLENPEDLCKSFLKLLKSLVLDKKKIIRRG